jgi:hypothetical protein
LTPLTQGSGKLDPSVNSAEGGGRMNLGMVVQMTLAVLLAFFILATVVPVMVIVGGLMVEKWKEIKVHWKFFCIAIGIASIVQVFQG